MSCQSTSLSPETDPHLSTDDDLPDDEEEEEKDGDDDMESTQGDDESNNNDEEANHLSDDEINDNPSSDDDAVIPMPCYAFKINGCCQWGATCRFQHLDKNKRDTQENFVFYKVGRILQMPNPL